MRPGSAGRATDRAGGSAAARSRASVTSEVTSASAFGVPRKFGFGVGRGARGVLRLLAADECVIERQAVVASRNGVVRLLERRARGLVFGRGVSIGPGGLGRVDRTLGLVHFLVGRRTTGRGEERVSSHAAPVRTRQRMKD